MQNSLHMKEDQYKHCRNIIKSTILILSSKHRDWVNVHPHRREEIINDIELGCWRRSIEIYKERINAFPIWDEQFDNIYQTICGKITLNLYPDGDDVLNVRNVKNVPNVKNVKNDTKNTIKLLSKIISGELDPLKIGSMTEAELLPEASAELRHEWELRKGSKIKKNYVIGKKCPKCKTSDKIDFNQAQKTAIDDGYLTTGYICDNCGYSWQ